MNYTGDSPPVKETVPLRSPEILYRCPRCGTAGRLRPPAPPSGPACRSCELVLRPADPGPWSEGRSLDRCPLCGDDKLYVQRDFDQRAGCAIVGLGAALVPWTYGLSLAVCALADWLLYRRLPPLTVCYVCGARMRGTPVSAAHAPFDLMSAQTWEARSLAWRKRHQAGN